MIHMLYLAAGSSRRFGGDKLMTPYEGIPLYRHGLLRLAKMTKARPDCTLTVVSRTKAILADAASLGARPVYSPDSEGGIAYSICAGIRSLTVRDGDSLLFAVADQPHMSARTLCALLDAAGQHPLCATVAYGERVGNPTLFSAALIPELLSLQGDTGGRKILRAHEADCVRIQCMDESELMDIDLPTDLPTETKTV